MQLNKEHIDTGGQTELERYYTFHSRIYDATRWSFLFGRKELINRLPVLPPKPNILEVGCGTGQNIRHLKDRFPDASVYGMDLSKEMLKKARKKFSHSDRITFIHQAYGSKTLDLPPFDLILLSYSFTMAGNSTGAIIQQISNDLKPNGYLAVVDFHSSPFKWFRNWMGLNHVNLDGQLDPLLHKHFHPVNEEIKSAYLGLWSYFLFIGQRG